MRSITADIARDQMIASGTATRRSRSPPAACHQTTAPARFISASGSALVEAITNCGCNARSVTTRVAIESPNAVLTPAHAGMGAGAFHRAGPTGGAA